MRAPISLHAPRWRSPLGSLRLALLLLGLSALLFTAQVRPDNDRAARVKAAYLYNFLLFVQWPQSNIDTPPRVCTLGSGPVNQALAPIEQRDIQGRRVLLQHLDNVAAASDCHLLFINESEEPGLKEILALLGDAPVLTVSDIPVFSRRGGMIEFVYQDRRTRLEINLHQALAVGLSISSNLLEVAAKVYAAEGGRP